MMKKFLSIFIGILIIVGLSSCGQKTEISATGVNTIYEGNYKIDKVTENEVAYVMAGVLMNLDTFEATTVGSSIAKKGFITYEQSIENRLVKNMDEGFSESKSSSSIVNMAHQAFYKSGKVVYRDSLKGDMKVAETEEYKNVYGVLPDYTNTLGFVLNDETILFSEKLNGYQYRYSLDVEKSTYLLRRQMKEFGSLNDYPTFKKVELIIEVQSDFKPVKITSNVEYDISLPILGKMSCKQTLETEFNKFNEKVEIPDHQEFSMMLGEEATEIPESGTNTSGDLELLLNYILEYGFDNGVTLRANKINIGDNNYTMPLDINIKVDMQDGNFGGIAVSLESVLVNKTFRLHYNSNYSKVFLEIDKEKLAIEIPTKKVLSAELPIKVIKVNDVFVVNLKEEIITAVNLYLNSLNYSIDKFEISLPIYEDSISSVNLELNLKDIAKDTNTVIKTDFAIFNSKYVVPNYDDFLTLDINNIIRSIPFIKKIVEDISKRNFAEGKEFTGSLSFIPPLQSDMPITGFVKFSDNKLYLKANIKFNGIVASMIPQVIGKPITEIGIELIPEGILNVYMYDKDGVVLESTQVDLRVVVLDLIINGGINNLSVGSVIKVLNGFTFEEIDGNIVVTGDEYINQLFSKLFEKLLVFVAENGGSLGGFLGLVFGDNVKKVEFTNKYVDGVYSGFALSIDAMRDDGVLMKNQVGISINF